MIFPIELSKNLSIISADAINTDGDTVLTARFYFSFFGQECEAVITKEKIEKDRPSFTGEAPSELFESFFAQLEEEKHWDKIKELFKQLETDWATPLQPYVPDLSKEKAIFWKEDFIDEDTGDVLTIERKRYEDNEYELEEGETLITTDEED